MLSAFPARTRQLLCLVGAEVSASPGAWPQPRPPDDLGLRYRYQLTSVSPLGIGPAALTALLAGAALAGSGTATGPGGARVRARQTTGVPPPAAGPAALSTVVYAKGRLTAHGTGPPGPGTASGAAGGVRAGHVVVLGGTGPARLAVARAAIGLGAERLTLVGAVPGRTEAASAAWPARYSPGRVRAACPGELAAVLADADGLIRAVPAGTRPQSPVPVPARLLRPAMWVADLAYRPPGGQSPRHARGGAGPAAGGTRDGMLAWQTVGAFRLATGSGTEAEQTLRYLAAVTGTVAGNARVAPVRAAPAR